MKTNGIFLKWGLLFLMCDGVWAQSINSKSTLPLGPLLNHVPRPGSWSVTYTYPEENSQEGQGAPAALSNNIRNVTTEVFGKLTHVMITRVGGQVQNIWKSGVTEYGQSGLNAPWSLNSAGSAAKAVQNQFLDGTDFPGLEWLNADCFIGIIKYQNMDCLLFAMTEKEGVDINDSEAINDMIKHASNLAVIDMKSRNPLVVTYSGVKEIFQYQSAPSTLSLPADLAGEIMQEKRAQDRLSMRAPRPY